MSLFTTIEQRKIDFIAFCQKHNVKKLYAFGSSITERFDETRSDIDLVVDVGITDPVKKGETLLSLWDDLEQFFGRKVDLLTPTSIVNPYLKANIERTRKLIYDGEGEKILI